MNDPRAATLMIGQPTLSIRDNGIRRKRSLSLHICPHYADFLSVSCSITIKQTLNNSCFFLSLHRAFLNLRSSLTNKCTIY